MYDGCDRSWIAPGAKGDKGDAGAAGANGINGTNGIDGATGATGAQGPKGDAGAAGVAGPQGPKGDPGTAAVSGTVLLLVEGAVAPAGYVRVGAYVEERIDQDGNGNKKPFKMRIVIWQKQ